LTLIINYTGQNLPQPEE